MDKYDVNATVHVGGRKDSFRRTYRVFAQTAEYAREKAYRIAEHEAWESVHDVNGSLRVLSRMEAITHHWTRNRGNSGNVTPNDVEIRSYVFKRGGDPTTFADGGFVVGNDGRMIKVRPHAVVNGRPTTGPDVSYTWTEFRAAWEIFTGKYV